MTSISFEQITKEAKSLSPLEKLQLIEQLSTMLKEEIAEEQPPKPRKSLLGIWAKYGTAPSAEEIDEARREMWGNFPREDI